MWRKEERRSSLWAACFSEFNPNNGPAFSGFLCFILPQTGAKKKHQAMVVGNGLGRATGDIHFGDALGCSQLVQT